MSLFNKSVSIHELSAVLYNAISSHSVHECKKKYKKYKKKKLSEKKYLNKSYALNKTYDNDEEYFANVLKMIQRICKELFRETFKKMLTADRILHKVDPLKENSFDMKLRYIKEQEEFKKETFKNMFLLRENVENGKEDEIFFEDGMFDDFDDLDSLKWLIKKKNILTKHSKLTGAYNPKEKMNFNIHYP